jgi:ankyrin repeat protein
MRNFRRCCSRKDSISTGPTLKLEPLQPISQLSEAVTKLLIKHGADMVKANEHGGAPIYIASVSGRNACLALLVNSGADLNLRLTNRFGLTPVILCCQYGHAKCLALLCDGGADLDLRTYKYGLTAVQVACQDGHLKCLQLLAMRGADLNKIDEHGGTPLDHARIYKQRECIDFLLDNGATGRRDDEIFLIKEDHKVGMAAYVCASSNKRLKYFSINTPYYEALLHYSKSQRRLFLCNGRQLLHLKLTISAFL